MSFHLHVQTVGITSRLPPLCCWEPLHECHHWHHRDALGKHSRESSSAIPPWHSSSAIPPWHRRHLVVGERRLGATSYASVSGALTPSRYQPRHHRRPHHQDTANTLQTETTATGPNGPRHRKEDAVPAEAPAEAEVNLLFVTRLLKA